MSMSSITTTASFKACYKNLSDISLFVTKAANAAELNEQATYAVQRAVDEACSNIIEHAYQGKEGGDIECLCIACEYGLIVQLRDYGKPFEPKKIPSPNLKSELAERSVGGLGLYFMHRLMDEVSFEFSSTDNGNSVTMVKYNDRHFQIDVWHQIITLAERITALPNISEQYEYICEMAAQLFGGQVTLWLNPAWVKVDGLSNRVEMLTKPPNNLMQRAYKSRKAITSNKDSLQVANKLGVRKSKKSQSANVHIIANPLIANEKLFGVLQINRQSRTISNVELKALDGFANQVAMALLMACQSDVERRRLEQLSLVRSVSAQIANVFDLDELARRVTRLLLETFNYYYVGIFTYEAGQDILYFRASAGPMSRNSGSLPLLGIPLQVQLGRGLIGLAASTGKESLANDVRSDPHYQYHETLPETLSEVAIPLKLASKVLGVLDVQSNALNSFDETDILLLQSLADNIAIAVEGTLLYIELRKRAEQLATVSEISNAITSLLSLDDLLVEIIHLIRGRLGYSFIQIFTVNLAYNDITYIAGSSPRNEEYCTTGLKFKLDEPSGLIPWTARNASTVIANDISQEPLYKPTGDFSAEIRSELVIPLIFGGQVQGILDVQSDHINAFSDDERDLFEALADNIATAIRNAQLYKSERWRRQVADSMHAVAGLLSADVSISHLLESILTELERALPCDTAAIWLVENRDNDSERDAPPRFQLAAIHSHDGEMVPEDIERDLDEITDSRAWLGEALNAEQPLIRVQGNNVNGSPTHDPFGSVFGLPDDYSAIAAPLRAGNMALGVLTLTHHTPGRYGAESQAMTATFASYAAVAIENVKLYEATHDQAWVSTVLLQVAEATQSITDIDELLSTVVQITPLLVGVNACALMMWDDSADAFVPGAAQGLTSEQQDNFDQWIVHPGDEEAFDQLREIKTPILLTHWSFTTTVNKENSSEEDASRFESYRSRPLVLFPMVVQDAILGGLLVDFAGTEFRSDTDIDNEEFLHDEKLAVIQGIAHQTAIAVENIRLLKSQKEEAYVSVALLQVAQAVVSLINLDEILETIVRIAPILVGVNRCAIYLWDETRVGFWLAQSYGFPREEEDLLSTRFYLPGEFPLLDAVYKHDKLLHIAIDDMPVQPTEWEKMIPEEATISLSTETGEVDEEPQTFMNGQGITDEILKHYGSLLFAFPLSVKGTVLGVFVAEEAASLIDAPTYRVRERRLEILTGITQQAALAIQNDRLQSEVVERERLEREMQLARTIQSTFLPHHIPSIPDWELDMRWRTARQVGGDYYDIIELPNQKLGLVIADVADKGMPAALFMTLVRTLIRAAAHEEESPAAVLEEVNNLMIPDTQNGMFVTVIYAVLSLNTGHLVYSNAGHNLPILLSSDGKEVTLLHKGGMALGILENIHLEDHVLELKPGNCVIFYTDGVTEAFSPEEEMYGEERLYETIRAANCNSASKVLDTIDRSVSEFIGDNPRTDDLTMVAIRRVGP